jgi:hypothetical protein
MSKDGTVLNFKWDSSALMDAVESSQELSPTVP